MIGKLKGIVEEVAQDSVIIDVAGVGYIVNCSSKTIANVPNIGKHHIFLIHMQVKEDDISLFGFTDIAEKQWFENLITVQGIGPRLALVILSSLEPGQLVRTIIERDKEVFKHISGVGPKLAERIFTELSKCASQDLSNFAQIEPLSQENNDNIRDALVALINLGYNKAQAQNICKNICKNNPDISLNDLIRLALKGLAAS